MLDHVWRVQAIDKLVDQHLVGELDFGGGVTALRDNLLPAEDFDKFVALLLLLGVLVVLAIFFLNEAAFKRL